jgi:SOS-response transcriptional repressor LexA
MINSINGNQMQFQPNFNFENKLTEDQKTTLTEIISKYDPENMSEETTKQMMDEIKEAGITPSKEFGEIMDKSGFKRPEPPKGGPMPPKSEIPNFTNKNSVELYLSFMSKQETGSATKDDFESLIQQLTANGEDLQGIFIDKKS